MSVYFLLRTHFLGYQQGRRNLNIFVRRGTLYWCGIHHIPPLWTTVFHNYWCGERGTCRTGSYCTGQLIHFAATNSFNSFNKVRWNNPVVVYKIYSLFNNSNHTKLTAYAKLWYDTTVFLTIVLYILICLDSMLCWAIFPTACMFLCWEMIQRFIIIATYIFPLLVVNCRWFVGYLQTWDILMFYVLFPHCSWHFIS